MEARRSPYLKKRLAWALELTCWKRMPPVA